ncbi:MULTISPECIES: glucose-6-phosphate isomerase [unclassified Undibacterium]|uniref:glucose-6-phosphate isomerase n=1 Tax=unclassified Undibacterium TaxID=2630295 RepID=UPI002AC9AF92|nr:MULTISPECIES: glucose-6-phosphate isomerase [unclassified Undibacterium]MEB0139259.1 glucose-6-phosphate isomerase [Undibacterium sp. CCC2.1]MEB0172103.1 glucose-6-phosphate isomerase [Undibacterium sp. CCC1.1]MEB0175978.1 glucose-6-phosphate isomerase [Undibacterium sp. CCC3.4]MEB0215290.1 glucose-6-phosphate isomerase [Undibacterium sp. 5I2]WPX45464.1 glucose-6-phosphate isomerase [Undibacterium sp. CCC3.4]
MNITQTPEWQSLLQHRQRLEHTHLRELFAQDPLRFEHFSAELDGLLIDYSKQRIDQPTLDALLALARLSHVEEWRDRMFAGERINISEDRAVLHTALRHMDFKPFPSAELDVMPQVRGVRKQMRDIVERVRSGLWRGFKGDAIQNIVNIGIGGSDLGPKLATRALAAMQHPNLKFFYVSNLDSAHLAPLLEELDPRTTLFIVASKTFTTQETNINAQTARTWLMAAAMEEWAIGKHFIAVTASTDKAHAFGIPDANILPLWDWVGGRYSLWSAVGLSVALAIGMSGFERLLLGAETMDAHFCATPLEQNLPVLLALISVWNTNFLGAETTAILPYNESLRHLPAFLQQLEMESNGKTVGREGEALTCRANPIVWGEIGVNGQHAFFQLLHQGGWLIPCDFVVAASSDYPLPGHQAPLLANCLAQSAALAFGKTEAQAREELMQAGMDEPQIAKLLPHKVFAGNQPSTTLLMPALEPFQLGMLLALYEHKVFVQGVIWGINSFDQWGVELGKQLANRLLPAIMGDQAYDAQLDASTSGLIAYFRRHGHV